MNAALADRLARAPEAALEVIVAARGGLDALYDALPEGVRVVHAYRLVDSLAIEATGAAIAALARHPAVGAIEAVRDVRAWDA